MNDTNERSCASRGSHGEPVAWAIQWDGSDTPDLEWVFPEKRDVDLELLETTSKGVAVPLYRQPQPTLTDEEREAIAWIALTHSRLKTAGNRPGRTPEQDLDAVWGFLDRTK